MVQHILSRFLQGSKIAKINSLKEYIVNYFFLSALKNRLLVMLPEFISLLLLLKFCGSTVVIPNTKPSSCSKSQYFQASSLQCVSCGSHQKQSPDVVSCDCAAGAKLLSDLGGPNKDCEMCTPPKVVSDDGWHCIECPLPSDYLSSTKTCSPCKGPLEVGIDRSNKGTIQAKRFCLQCSGDTSPGALSPIYKIRCRKN